MSLFAGGSRVYQYEQTRDTSHLETLTMQSMTLPGAAILVATLLAGCGAESGPTASNTPSLAAGGIDRTVVHESQVLDLDETYVNPCNGETVHLTGTLVGHTNFVNDLHSEFHATISETGTGLTTGTSYTSHSTFNEVFNSPTEAALNLTHSFRDAVHVISSPAGLSFRLKHTFHVTVLPHGGFNVTKEIDSAVCQG